MMISKGSKANNRDMNETLQETLKREYFGKDGNYCRGSRDWSGRLQFAK